MDSPPSKSWSIHTRKEITSKYEIFERVGSGAYSDVYRGRRRSDSLTVALKEIHDYQSALREIEALQTLQNCPNVVVLHEFFWSEDDDSVLVLEFLPTDLGAVIKAAKKIWDNGLTVGEIKRWMVQILCAVDACHRNSIVHRDLKPSNLLISEDGILKLADFGQARMLLAPGLAAVDDGQPYGKASRNVPTPMYTPEFNPVMENAYREGQSHHYQRNVAKEDRIADSDEFRYRLDDIDSIQDGNTSCLATCTNSDFEDDPLKSSYVEDEEGDLAPLTSCVGTRWFRAPELLYGSVNYGPEIDLWSLGCIFAELLSLEPLFPGTSDIDQLGRIFTILGNLSEEVWPGCVHLPDYKTISFNKVEKQTGLEACLPNRSPDEILLVKKLLCYDPAGRATSMELLHDKYLNEDPLPVLVSELRVPPKNSELDEDSPGEWGDLNSDSDMDDFGPVQFSRTENGFSVQFS
nr:cyclin-dependent kinase F-1 [Ipomoea batatas]